MINKPCLTYNTLLKIVHGQCAASFCIAQKLTSYLNACMETWLNVFSKSCETVFLAAVYGPIEVKIQKFQIDKASIETVYKPKSGQSSLKERIVEEAHNITEEVIDLVLIGYYQRMAHCQATKDTTSSTFCNAFQAVGDRIKENFIKNICEAAILTSLHPRTAINIVIQEMQDCGGGLACAVNAACLALVNSGLSMRYIIAAVSCMIDGEGEIIVDPDNKQLQRAQGTMTFVFDNALCDVIGLHTDGLISEDQHEEALRRCKLCAEEFFVYLRDIVRRYANRI